MTTTTANLIESVLALIGTPRDDPQFNDRALTVLDLCTLALNAAVAARSPTATAVGPVRAEPAELGRRIAQLAATGKGVREIARALGVNPSTVSRRLRRVVVPIS